MSVPLPSIAVVGAGPVGLCAAQLLAQALPRAAVSVFDARPLDADLTRDARTLALSLGSVQLLQRLQAWPAEQAEPITTISVSQVPPGAAELRLTAAEMRAPLLGAVLAYGSVLGALQDAWLRQQAAAPQRLRHQFGQRATGLKSLADGRVELDAGVAEAFDLVVLAEGGLFADQVGREWRRDYGQTAWVGELRLGPGVPRGLAVERFTRSGPLALLPLPDDARGRRAALVWCVGSADDPVTTLDDEQRLTALRSLFPPEARDLTGIGPLKAFPLGLNAERQQVQGRVVRIGNASQTLHPVAGQGLNLGLRDAVTVARALRDAAGLDEGLARFQRQRTPDRWMLMGATDLFARGFAVDLPWATGLRELGLRAMQHLPPLRQALARQMMFGWR
ncbi:MAG: FAD-dependent monooxygenase [Inhella sp.]|uniref:FAD-dependent monooxygenase n=1 Tax=Inhella sp. TaxID=1921806 RepID=UPI0022BD6C1D|nr:FAD-dependent monooxygenase [Inhella sp.]MCZ8235840.1 FAD-dependent monooxygenase [Inhella sp.]